ncbi:Putative zn(2)-C6 fungal-type DNA-binding domain-containing protein [Septoria linicola]|uniref:Zn(2)-C6 fungal-type DNA-binding domain-containing protein n=1 Tax=Septoria linicola TaxID=215465 RepID=A0A9Q9AU90_9PEZI|nr:Putative zn(2)-C6 fungal-type DNA-binding domain-containing protein [Septoria linicola]
MKRDGIDNDGQSEKVKKTLRGRAEKACVRCRAKKRTCDGGNPCLRCKESHSACYFSDWHYTVPYPREYVEYLEEQQEQLSAGLMTMYRILKESNIQTMPILPDKPQTQDLLAALRGLKLSSQSHHLARSGSTTSDGLKDGHRTQFEEVPIPPQKDYHGSVPSPMNHPSTTSPLQPASMFMPHFGSAPSSHSPNMTAHASNPTPVHHTYAAAPYRPFDFARPVHPHAQVPPHSLQPAQPARHGFLPCRDGAMQMPEPWHPSPASLTPTSNAPLEARSDRPTPLASTPNTFTEPRHENLHMQQHNQQHISQPWAWGVGPDLSFYANNALGSHHDSRIGQIVEPIEQRGDIVAPHDSQAPC